MPMLLKFICLTFALSVFIADTSKCQTTSSEVHSDSLSLRLYFDNVDFLYGQEILAHVVLKNISDHILSVLDFRYPKHGVAISDKNGNQLSDYGHFPNYGRIPNVPLSPGDSLQLSTYLCRAYGFSYKGYLSSKCISQGETLVRAGYAGTLHTQFIAINLALPEGDEKILYDGLTRASTIRAEREWKKPLLIVDSLLTDYPESRYFHEACNFGIFTARVANDTLHMIKYSGLLIRAVPNHQHALDAFDRILSFSPSSAASFCDSIATAYPNTRLVAHAREKLAILNAQKH